eukprot:6190387-Pleurochrysis_carterae.AAC.1
MAALIHRLAIYISALSQWFEQELSVLTAEPSSVYSCVLNSHHTLVFYCNSVSFNPTDDRNA